VIDLPKVNLLDELTANQIAAGEVIERPVSVVKELVENSLDAGAHNILVEIRDGGLTLIRVSDDGVGMSEEDLCLAIKRHATSKLQSIDDLQNLYTLGFRGEALPSITAVARVEIFTREKEAPAGTKLRIEGGDIKEITPAGSPVGTTVSVTDLFYNTPARRKFLRPPGYEGSLIHELLLQLALSHPEINFRLLNQGREVLNTKGINRLEDLLTHFYGNNVREALIKIEGKASQSHVRGFVTGAAYHKVNRSAIHFFINHRRIISRELMKAVEEAYANTLPKGRFPVAVLHINLQPSLIDVNVHPSKLEVRIRDSSFSKDLCLLLKDNLQTNLSLPKFLISIKEPASFSPKPLPSQESWQDFYGWQGQAVPTKQEESKEESKFSYQDDVEKPVHTPPAQVQEKVPAFQHHTGGFTKEDLSLLKIIGQMADTFILAEGEDGLYIIDQHVAHERILYERLLKQAESGTVESQFLLQPVTLQLTALEEELIVEHILLLNDLGIILEYFGPRCYLLRAVPAGVDEDPGDFFFQLLQELSNKVKKLTPADIKKEVLLVASCKGAVKANQKLTLAEMTGLLHDLKNTDHPSTCPHGRPIFYRLTHTELLKAFRRI
jgi:DNA mismatch repair protein MutL